MNVTQGRSLNPCCRGKAIRITYYECVCGSLVVQHAMRMCGVVVSLWPLWLYDIFFYIIS